VPREGVLEEVAPVVSNDGPELQEHLRYDGDHVGLSKGVLKHWMKL
jgi:hypothetical protein